MVKKLIIGLFFIATVTANAGIGSTVSGWIESAIKLASENQKMTSFGLGALCGAAAYFSVKDELFQIYDEIIKELNNQQQNNKKQSIRTTLKITNELPPRVDKAITAYDNVVQENSSKIQEMDQKLRNAIAYERLIIHRIPKFIGSVLVSGLLIMGLQQAIAYWWNKK